MLDSKDLEWFKAISFDHLESVEIVVELVEEHVTMCVEDERPELALSCPDQDNEEEVPPEVKESRKLLQNSDPALALAEVDVLVKFSTVESDASEKNQRFVSPCSRGF